MAKGNSGINNKRGASGSGKFNNVDDFEKSLTGFDDPRLKEYEDAYSDGKSYNKSFENNMKQTIADDGYDDYIDAVLNSEKTLTQNELNNLPERKTPAQLGQETALNERLQIIDRLSQNKTTVNTKYTQSQLNAMDHTDLVRVAYAVAQKIAPKQGISAEEALSRARALMGSQTDAQLRRYIKRNG